MPPESAAEPKTAEALRHELRSELLRRERKLRGKSNPEMGALAGVSGPTFSHAANGWKMHEDTWIVIGEGLGWGAFLDYVASGNIAAIERGRGLDGVPQTTKDIAVEQLRAIAENGN